MEYIKPTFIKGLIILLIAIYIFCVYYKLDMLKYEDDIDIYRRNETRRQPSLFLLLCQAYGYKKMSLIISILLFAYSSILMLPYIKVLCGFSEYKNIEIKKVITNEETDKVYILTKEEELFILGDKDVLSRYKRTNKMDKNARIEYIDNMILDLNS